MGCDTYSVLFGDLVLAKGMSLENAFVFTEAMFQKCWREEGLRYTVVREPKAVASA